MSKIIPKFIIARGLPIFMPEKSCAGTRVKSVTVSGCSARTTTPNELMTMLVQMPEIITRFRFVSIRVIIDLKY